MNTQGVMSILAICVVIGFLIILSLLIVFPADLGDPGKIALGAFGAGFGVILNYYFGSSAGSRAKDAVIEHQHQGGKS